MLIYIIGKISDPNPVDYLRHVAVGNAVFCYLLKQGHSPYWGGMDACAILSNSFVGDGTSMVKLLQKNSIEWLKKADCCVAMPTAPFSKGSKKEIEVAQELGIPVLSYETYDELDAKLAEYEKSRVFPIYKID